MKFGKKKNIVDVPVEEAKVETAEVVIEPKKKSRKGVIGFVAGIVSAIIAGLLVLIFGCKSNKNGNDSNDGDYASESDSSNTESDVSEESDS